MTWDDIRDRLTQGWPPRGDFNPPTPRAMEIGGDVVTLLSPVAPAPHCGVVPTNGAGLWFEWWFPCGEWIIVEVLGNGAIDWASTLSEGTDIDGAVAELWRMVSTVHVPAEEP